MIVRRVLPLVALFAALVAAPAAHAVVVDPGGHVWKTWYYDVDPAGSDADCRFRNAPGQAGVACRTLAGALARAEDEAWRSLRLEPGYRGRDFVDEVVITLPAGTVAGGVTTRLPTDLQIRGRGAATLISGGLVFANAHCAAPALGVYGRCGYFGPRRTQLSALAVRGDVLAPQTALSLDGVAVAGRVAIGKVAAERRNSDEGVAPSLVQRSTISAGGSCEPALTGPSTTRAQASQAPSVQVRDSTLSGAVGIDLPAQGTASVDGTVVSVAGPACGRLMGISARLSSKAWVNRSLISLVDPTCGTCGRGDKRFERAGISAGEESTVGVAETTIGGPFSIGVDAWQSAYVTLERVAIDGAAVGVDTRSAAGRSYGILDADVVVHASGPIHDCRAGRAPACAELGDLVTAAGRVRLVRTPLGLNPDWGYYPRGDSPTVDAIANAGPDSAINGRDLGGQGRPVGAGFDVGAWERGAIAPADARPAGAPPVGPDWLGADLMPGGVVGGVVDGVGVPLRPGVAAVAAGADGTPASAAVAAAAARPALLIEMPARVRQGATLDLRIKVPYRGRLTVRLVGANGGLVNVARGRAVVRGWRHVRIRIGPNARVGTLRAFATHDRPGRERLSGVGVGTVVKRPRG